VALGKAAGITRCAPQGGRMHKHPGEVKGAPSRCGAASFSPSEAWSGSEGAAWEEGRRETKINYFHQAGIRPEPIQSGSGQTKGVRRSQAALPDCAWRNAGARP